MVASSESLFLHSSLLLGYPGWYWAEGVRVKQIYLSYELRLSVPPQREHEI